MSSPARVHAVILAAGRGRRMGRPKHLLPVEGSPMLVRVIRALCASRADAVSVVLRPGDAVGAASARAWDVPVVYARDPAEGRAASVRAGLTRVPESAAVLFALADQPYLEAADFNALIEAFAARGAGIVHASYAGVRGSPVLFAPCYRPELLRLRGGEGGRVVIQRHPDDALGIELEPARGRDLDRPADLPADVAIDVRGREATLPRPVERTLAIIKPDAVAARRIGPILEQIEGSGLEIVAMRMLRLTRERARAFYAVHRERPFFGPLVEFMISGPIVVAVVEGEGAIARYRALMGATDPAEAAEGSIRRRFATDIERNAVHGSDGPETARTEVAFFFSDEEILERT